jgi:4-alpha-glucanotransferase
MASRRRTERSRRASAPQAPFGQRSSGVLLHPTSLPGPHGNGDLSEMAARFVKYLASAGQTWWQMLPVGPPGRGNSPYDSESSFAGSPLLVSLVELVKDGWLDRSDLAAPTALGGGRVDYDAAWHFREPRLRRAAERFRRKGGFQCREFKDFRGGAAGWLGDYALFSALRAAHHRAPWTEWDRGLAARQPAAIARARRTLEEEIGYHEFVQYCFERQWKRLRAVCERHGVRLLGDVPMFVAHDSAEVWSHREVFRLDPEGRPLVVAGVPPDCFSRHGQLWGNPIYRWDVLALTEFSWWVERLACVLGRFDAVRLDHFIGFHRYWEVAAGARTARRGRFVLVPGAGLLATVESKLGRLPLVAEDLGLVVPEVAALRDQFDLPGMRVLEFGFGDAPGDRDHLPHRYPRRLVAYTGTHDNDTLVGWFRQRGPRGDTRARREADARRARVLRYTGSDGREIHWDLIRLVMLSAADTVILPLQDLLGLDSRARMNVPGVPTGNWEWRARPEHLCRAVALRLRELTETFDRAPPAEAPGRSPPAKPVRP